MISEVDHLHAFATRFCPLQFENCTCTLFSRNDTRVHDAHLQTLLSNMQKRTKMSRVKKFKFVLASLLPCQSVMNKNQASQSWLIYGNMPIITCWKPVEHGWKVFPLHVIKCHRKCSVKMMGLLMTTMTLVMNAIPLLQCSMRCSNLILTYSSVLHVNCSHGSHYWHF